METVTESAVVANALYQDLMIGLGVRPLETTVAEYKRIRLHEEAEMRLESMAPILAEIARSYGFRYESPHLTEAGEQLITNSWTKFIKEYAYCIRESMRSAMPGFICI